ncbi:acyl carrier protein [Kitasatospora sp. NPDC059327]|uniref:acyl carrier protein n=1 Tax=Kitasatospora sp. NPDC059327 TaxID=3346803 RepID=UPI0036837C9E
MTAITLAQLVEIIRDCAGDSDEFDLNGDIADIAFEELGYDSLALLEIAARLRQEHGVVLPDEGVRTPGDVLDLVNEVPGQGVA